MSYVVTVLKAPFSRRTWSEAGYLLVTLPISLLLFPIGLVGLVATVLSLVGIGLPVLALVLALCRNIDAVMVVPAGRLVGWSWPGHSVLGAETVFAKARRLYGDGLAWRGLVYAIVKFPLTLVATYLSAIGFGLGAAAATSPIWYPIIGNSIGALHIQHWPQTLSLCIQGALLFLFTPWFVRFMVAIDRRITFGLLVEDRSQARIDALEKGRRALVEDSTERLRRLERNLHDGTQARLVMIGLVLNKLERQSLDDTATATLAEAQGSVRDALSELREIIRGVGPPALDDGLPAAISSLSAHCAIPMSFEDHSRSTPSRSLATTLYFATTELIGNAARHSHANHIWVELSENEESFVLEVRDNGSGGARETFEVAPGGTGLAGIRRRIEALDGGVDIQSPEGGPTKIVLELPKEVSS